MYRLAMSAWLLIPLALTGLHFGPGRSWLARDDAATLLRTADRLAQQEQWDQAAIHYTKALAALPQPTTEDRLPLEVALGRARVMAGEIVEGQELLAQSLAEMERTGQSNSPLAREAHYELGTASYYAAWIMRMEGATAEEWLPEAEQARQQFRWVAENSEAAVTDESQHSLEATIRLEQMDLSELLALPKPKKCPNCKQGHCQRKRKQSLGKCESPGEEKGQEPKEQDARKEIKKQSGAGLYTGERTGS